MVVLLALLPAIANAQDDALDVILATPGESASEGSTTSAPSRNTAGSDAGDGTAQSEPTPLESIPVSAIRPSDAETTVATPKSRSRFIEEVVVTAQKREENLQEVPISIQAFSGDALDVRGIQNPTDLKMVTPALVYDELVGYSVIYMRGIGADLLTPTAEPSVATYIDGVYLPLNHGLAKDFTPLERIEVLKGPQGTLFGRNATGGALNIVTVKPSDDWRVVLDAGIGSFSEKRGKAYVAGPVFDGVSFSLAGLYASSDPYYELSERSPQEALRDNTTRGLSPRLLWNITDELSASASAYLLRFYGTGTVINSQLDPTLLGTAAGSRPTAPRETAFNEPGTLEAATDVYSLTLEYHPGAIDFKLIGSYQENLTDTRWDYDNGPVPAVYFYPTGQYLDATTGELQVISNDATLWSDHLEWVAGLYYYQADAGIDPIFVGIANLDTIGLPDGVTNVLDGVRSLAGRLGIPLPASVANVILRGGMTIDSWAAYAQMKWKATDWLNLTVGARQQTEERRLVKSSVGVIANGFDDSSEIRLINFLAARDYEINKRDLSPRVALDITPTDELLIYASYSQAFKSATFNLVNVYLPPSMVRPEKTTAYEIGAKGSLFDGALRYSGAIFRNDVEDIQTMVLSIFSGGLINIVNAAEARIEGAELDLTWELFPTMLPGLVLTASAGYLDGAYTRFPEGAGFDEVTGLAFGASAPLPARDFSGNDTVRTPEFTGSLGLGYTFQVPGGDLEIAADVYHNSGYFFDAQNTTEQPEYALLNARLSYFIAPWNLRVTANGMNLTDELYYANIFPNDFGQAATGAPPRAYTLGLKWDLR